MNISQETKIGAALVVCVAFIAYFIITTVLYAGDTYCASYAEATGRTTKVVKHICLVQDGKEWFTLEEFKFRGAAK